MSSIKLNGRQRIPCNIANSKHSYLIAVSYTSIYRMLQEINEDCIISILYRLINYYMTYIKQLTVEDYARFGQVLFNKHLKTSALACFRKSANLVDLASSEAPKVLYLLGHCLWQMKQYSEAESVLRHAMVLDPLYPEPVHILANVHVNKGEFDLAEEAFKRTLTLLGNAGRYSKDVVVDYALFKLYLGQYREGFDLFEARREHFKAAYIDSIPQWDGVSDISNQTLYVYSEQGVGDILQFSRYLPLIRQKCGKLIFGSPPELIPLFRSFPKNVIDVLVPRLLDAQPPRANVCLPLVSCARFFDVPADPGYFLKFAKAHPFVMPERDEKPRKIGICWSGNPTHSRDRERSVALETLMPLTWLADVQLYSFQVGQRSGEVDLIGAQALVYKLDEQLTDWGKTASALLEMDLIITVDTALAHLAGALGVPTWVMIASDCDWRWGVAGTSTPWYESVVLWRQTSSGDWKGIVERMLKTLK